MSCSSTAGPQSYPLLQPSTTLDVHHHMNSDRNKHFSGFLPAYAVFTQGWHMPTSTLHAHHKLFSSLAHITCTQHGRQIECKATFDRHTRGVKGALRV